MLVIGMCDDNEYELADIRHLCEEVSADMGQSNTYKCFSSGKELLSYVHSEAGAYIDLLFLDVEMPHIDGIKIKEYLADNDKVKFIAFITAHDEYIRQAFGYKVIRYVKKPADRESIQKSIAIAEHELSKNIYIEITDMKGNTENINSADIMYIKASGSYSYIYMKSGQGAEQRYIVAKKLGTLEQNLPVNMFVRVHKSYIVNLKYVINIKDNVVLKEMDETIPIGRSYRRKLSDGYHKYNDGEIKIRF